MRIFESQSGADQLLRSANALAESSDEIDKLSSRSASKIEPNTSVEAINPQRQLAMRIDPRRTNFTDVQNLITFQGMTFSLDDGIPHLRLSDSDAKNQNKQFLDFQEMLKEKGILDEPNTNGQVLFADEKLTDHRLMESYFTRLQMQQNLTIHATGKETLESIDEALSKVEQDARTGSRSFVQPIPLIILDVDLPINNGFEVTALIK